MQHIAQESSGPGPEFSTWLTRMAAVLLLMAGGGASPASTEPEGAATEHRAEVPVADLDSGSGETPVSSIDSLPVQSRRIPEDWIQAPAAISVVDRTDIQLGRQQLGLDESLSRVPGLFMQNRTNFAQDLRISSRGFGARSSFGIRGIKVFVDGIPATLADGQAGVDAIDLGSTGRIEVLRGPASSLYGSAAGGVIHLHTEEPPDRPFVEGRTSFGAQGFARQQLKTGGRGGPVDYLLSLSRTHVDGYRNQSGFRASNLNGRLRWQVDQSSQLEVVLNAVDSPKADDPGGLTRAEVHADRRQARARNLLFDTGEEVSQQKLGLLYRKALGDAHEVVARSYLVRRDFENRLPFTSGGAVDLERLFFGGGLSYRGEGTLFDRRHQVIIGLDVDAQRDRRKRFDNLHGARGPLVFDQHEDVTGWGLYGQGQIDLGHDLELTLGARFDRVEFDIDDDFLVDGDDSGKIHFDEFSPALALLWHPMAAFNVYGRISTSFETPTTTELANPEGTGGFNSSLDPQIATGYELGVKGLLPGRLRYELLYYHIDVEDELVPFEVASMPERRFFRNAGESTRRGVEAALEVEPYPGLTLSLAYAHSDLRFDRYRTPSGRFDGNRIPGAPRNQLHAEIAYRHGSGLFVTWDALYLGHVYLNDANSAKDGSSLVSNFRVAWPFDVGSWQITPFFGIHNLFDRAYQSNVRINAFGSRYYEPAPDRNLYGGVSLRWEFGSAPD
ncbi:MAG: TonB-dependent receptor [bacterium]|nr:TonB-dependent receptor [bacterium]MCP5065094.1 TonB-dependent receptor [bacterium]